MTETLLSSSQQAFAADYLNSLSARPLPRGVTHISAALRGPGSTSNPGIDQDYPTLGVFLHLTPDTLATVLAQEERRCMTRDLLATFHPLCRRPLLPSLGSIFWTCAYVPHLAAQWGVSLTRNTWELPSAPQQMWRTAAPEALHQQITERDCDVKVSLVPPSPYDEAALTRCLRFTHGPHHHPNLWEVLKKLVKKSTVI